MKTFLISYDLSKPENSQEYFRLIQMIKSVSIWAKPLESLWLIKSDLNSIQIATSLRTVIDHNDKFLVIEVANDWTSYNLSPRVVGWLKNEISK